MTNNNTFLVEESLAIVKAGKIFGSPYREGDSYYFTVYGNRNKKYSLEEAVNEIINNPSNPQWVGFEIEETPSFYSWEEPTREFVAKLSPKKKFTLTRGEGWMPELESGDLRKVLDAKDNLPHKWQRDEYLVLEEDLPNPYSKNDEVEILNFTPHSLNFFAPDSVTFDASMRKNVAKEGAEPSHVIPSSGMLSAKIETVADGDINGIPVFSADGRTILGCLGICPTI